MIFPAKYSGLQLVPFYKIHDARYIVYWQKKSPQSIVAGENQALKEENETYLATKTIDLVTPANNSRKMTIPWKASIQIPA
ncbi:DUF4986 domain-containing protein [Mucilaginibacter sp. SMC90]|uniref:DUF4986 domain-containing protein n=1 Tax=Mucilaginibacter sp. SMC90 TaxID=2929803 RepID=UPI002111D532|nr:DUF4986 domain-containing protein [Mucilaginibacter sp. SMC90]